MATENIVSKTYRVLTDASARVWDKISFWTKSSDVYNDSGNNLETTCGTITGITSSLTSTSTTMAASASAIKELNDKIADLNSNLNNVPKAYHIFGISIGRASGSESITIENDCKMRLYIGQSDLGQSVTVTIQKNDTTIHSETIPYTTDYSFYIEQDCVQGDVIKVSATAGAWTNSTVMVFIEEY